MSSEGYLPTKLVFVEPASLSHQVSSGHQQPPGKKWWPATEILSADGKQVASSKISPWKGGTKPQPQSHKKGALTTGSRWNDHPTDSHGWASSGTLYSLESTHFPWKNRLPNDKCSCTKRPQSMALAPKLMPPLDKQRREPYPACSPAKRHLADDEEVLTLHHLLLELLLDGQPHLVLVLVHVSTVNVAVPQVNRHLHSFCHFARRGLKGNETEGME